MAGEGGPHIDLLYTQRRQRRHQPRQVGRTGLIGGNWQVKHVAAPDCRCKAFKDWALVFGGAAAAKQDAGGARCRV